MVMLLGAFALSSCDLQPKIASIPDDIGAFISDRYPALLADPVEQPEIYNSAVTDYGVYASPELYGSENVDDYVLYASVDDYVLAPQDEDTTIISKVNKEEPTIQDTDSEETESDEEVENEILSVPEYKVAIEEKTETKQSGDFVVVARGDTLYSIAKKNNTTISELAKINSLSEPYTLSIGQKINLRAAKIDDKKTEKIVVEKVAQSKSENPVAKVDVKQSEVKTIEPEKNKITPSKKVEKENATKTAIRKSESTGVKRVQLDEITVERGDTLYSLSREYQIPVNDLAVLNKLSSPFTLSVGQKLKVPKLENVQVRSAKEVKKSELKTENKTDVKNKSVAKDKPLAVAKKTVEKKDVKSQTKVPEKKQKSEKSNKVVQQKSANVETKKKISSDPKKQLPKISARSSSKFSWPVRGKILSQYGAKNKGLFNDGINISASLGTPVRAAENGVVAYAGNEVKGMGNLIIIQHSDGWMTVYAHLDSMSVRRGTKVSVGQQIGKIGKTGKVDKPQLHFEIRKGTKAYNPISYLKK